MVPGAGVAKAAAVTQLAAFRIIVRIWEQTILGACCHQVWSEPLNLCTQIRHHS
jgi:hypothetical protein